MPFMQFRVSSLRLWHLYFYTPLAQFIDFQHSEIKCVTKHFDTPIARFARFYPSRLTPHHQTHASENMDYSWEVLTFSWILQACICEKILILAETSTNFFTKSLFCLENGLISITSLVFAWYYLKKISKKRILHILWPLAFKMTGEVWRTGSDR